MTIATPEVSFYVIVQQVSQAHLACRICRKSISSGQAALLVKFDQQAELEQFDQLLWQFDPASFLPHAIDDLNAPVCLSLNYPEQFVGDCLNLGQEIVDVQRFGRIFEIIDSTEQAKIAGRARFKAYRALGIEPVTHQM